jgi:uncharacterized membrane protein YecN with MAPEG domain
MDIGAIHAVALWVGLNLLLILILSMLVVRQRQKHKVDLGDGGIAEMAQAIRALGNATEYIPAGLVGLLVLAMTGTAASAVLVHIAGFLLFAGRVVHAIGLSNSGGASFARTIGMLATWVSYIFMIAAVLFNAIG